jgi:hypothetical protein
MMGYNGTTYDRIRSIANNADAVAVTTLGILPTGSYQYGFNGTTWDRLRVGADNSANTTIKSPVLPCRANASAPTWTEGNQVPCSTDLTGAERVQFATSSTLATSPAQISCSNVSATLVASSAGRHKVDFQSWTPANDVFICYAATCTTALANIKLGTSISLLAYTEDRYTGAVSCITSSSTTTVAVTDR